MPTWEGTRDVNTLSTYTVQGGGRTLNQHMGRVFVC